jgi:hypothetical protein
VSGAWSPAQTVDDGAARDWAHDAALAATQVPATGAEAADWTVRGWAEVALGCAVIGAPGGFRGLDDVVRASRVPCGGPFAGRLRALRDRGGDLPACYLGEVHAPPAEQAMTAGTGEACLILAGFCDALSAAITRLGPGQDGGQSAPRRAGMTDHLRWGERMRPHPAGYSYEVLPATIEQNLAWRSWLCLPGASGRRITVVDLAARPSASTRERVCHGIHNGAHLDHLGALADADRAGTWTHAPIEFGAGLLSAESFAMAVELLAAAECVLAGLSAEARQLLAGFVERIGRIPGYRGWYDQQGRRRGSAALAAATTVAVREFAALPALAANYVTGPVRLIGQRAPDPLLPPGLNALFRQRWAAAAARFPAAAVLAERAADLP